MRHPDFRVGGKIFATMGYPERGWAMVKLTPTDQQAFVAMCPSGFMPVKGKWGEQGCTNVALEAAPAGAVREALRSAYDVQVSAAARGRSKRSVRRGP
jgi:hypothetical protein